MEKSGLKRGKTAPLQPLFVIADHHAPLGDGDEGLGVDLPDDLFDSVHLVFGDDDIEDVLLFVGVGALAVPAGNAPFQLLHDL